MTQIKFERNEDGVAALMQSPEMMAACEHYAKSAVARLGDGYEVTTYTGVHRVNASIIATTQEAMQEQLDSNTMLKALK